MSDRLVFIVMQEIDNRLNINYFNNISLNKNKMKEKFM